jgi:hypothetical protein
MRNDSLEGEGAPPRVASMPLPHDLSVLYDRVIARDAVTAAGTAAGIPGAIAGARGTLGQGRT